MKLRMMSAIRCCSIILVVVTLFYACKKTSNTSSDKSHLQLVLSDTPLEGVKEVWIDIRQVEILMGDTTRPILLDNVHAGVYNLLELTGGKDTLLSDALIPAGTISQLRLILGDNNYLVTQGGEKILLKTPSVQQSGLKVQLHQDVSGGMLYRLSLDFDVARSLVFAGNSGNVILKPVLRVLSFVPSGGNISGTVMPDFVVTAVLAIQGSDTIASAFTNPANGGYLLKDVPAGDYLLSFVPTDSTYKTTQKNAQVTLGQTTVVETVQLQH